ncbi:asparagine synthase (glutamine-hydrolyzing) [Vibrio alginolyticus]|uniref:asparagine synthase (glutamine-hydrolyzing) n=1 Tax=Vibrio TaxID=662 RepID=UPI00079B2BA0|nr:MULTISPECIES: asparagine synthase (glutamine-hydrolyzing) [Vibrio]EJN3800944.1 asparagine synthase (glutamine-hydrolyzing) [Vibrio alginolyticus]EKZ8660005.1 asparagine synthase (glutamine-hydrolyzing) [Vibrio alginolyticus]ELA6600784.1 asparagine synthase (glutamine-hydrolyzing) [Vibrio alginolyticus]ELA8361492.1 asparagine synthase (glutamine-hydrolyzing) [Vibrio alginolyticus]KXZ35449.1 asparagine synthetase B [Vibrio alginolyticus]
MCGIFGYFDFSNRSLSEETVRAMGEAIVYRGPDGMGYYHREGRALGNQRLAILDLEHGQQPFYSDEHDIVVVQNGEIFNHVELAQKLAGTPFECKTTCDTEVLLRLYQKYGIDFISMLNGMFAISIYDKRIDTMFLIRDRVGEKPLYYANHNGMLAFGSEIKSILKVGIPRELNKKALDSYISYNYVVPPMTMFSGVEHVMPGSYLSISNSGIEEVSWWDVADVNPEEASEAAWIEQLDTTLDDAVRLRLRADVPFGAFLSGGVDSSSVVGYMAKHLEQPVKTFSIGFHDKKYDESPYAEAAANRFNTEHVCEKVEANLLNLWGKSTYHCDQPHGDVSFMPTYKVAELASKEVKMVLTGDGADELFAGYDKYKNFFDSDTDSLSDEEFQIKFLESISLFQQTSKSKLYSDSMMEALAGVDSHYFAKQAFKKVKHQDRVNQALYIDTKLLLPGNNLVKPDRMGMAVSIENRAPFLDFRMIELAFSIPGELKLHDGETKYIFKKTVSNLIGEELAYRKKQMFTVPIGEWLKTDLKDMVSDLLFSEKAKSRGIFNHDFVQELYENHCKGTSNNTREIRALMAVELWFREFID